MWEEIAFQPEHLQAKEKEGSVVRINNLFRKSKGSCDRGMRDEPAAPLK